MKTICNIVLFLVACMTVVACILFTQIGHAELVDRTTIRYKETPESSIIFEVTKQHAREVIEPQVMFKATLAQYKSPEVVKNLTGYVNDHTRYLLQHAYGIDPKNVRVENIYVGTPSTLPNGIIFVSDVKYKKGLFWNKLRAGFVIPAVKGFYAQDIVYFIY